jgi:hypothetical protein
MRGLIGGHANVEEHTDRAPERLGQHGLLTIAVASVFASVSGLLNHSARHVLTRPEMLEPNSYCSATSLGFLVGSSPLFFRKLYNSKDNACAATSESTMRLTTTRLLSCPAFKNNARFKANALPRRIRPARPLERNRCERLTWTLAAAKPRST